MRPTTVDDYLATFPVEVQIPLAHLRERIHAVLGPDTEESISYQMPTFGLHGRRVVHLAGWKSHVSLYPVPGDEDLRDDLAPYASGRGTLRFSLGEPLPFELIDRVVAALAAGG